MCFIAQCQLTIKGIRTFRFMIAAGYGAIRLYIQLVESTDNKLAAEVLRDIADEERIHAGEFLRLFRQPVIAKARGAPG